MICPVCCGTKRGKDFGCPDDCPHLARGTQRRPVAGPEFETSKACPVETWEQVVFRREGKATNLDFHLFELTNLIGKTILTSARELKKQGKSDVVLDAKSLKEPMREVRVLLGNHLLGMSLRLARITARQDFSVTPVKEPDENVESLAEYFERVIRCYQAAGIRTAGDVVRYMTTLVTANTMLVLATRKELIDLAKPDDLKSLMAAISYCTSRYYAMCLACPRQCLAHLEEPVVPTAK